MKKRNWLPLLAAAVAAFGVAGAAMAASSTSDVDTAPNALAEMAVGDIVYLGDIAIQRAADDDPGPAQGSDGAVTEGFEVTSFGGNKSLNKTLSLNSTCRYFFIWVNNTSSNSIQVTIGNDADTQEENFHQIPQGKYYIWSTNQWPAESQTVSFSNGAGMYGSAAARLCTTLAEASAHNG